MSVQRLRMMELLLVLAQTDSVEVRQKTSSLVSIQHWRVLTCDSVNGRINLSSVQNTHRCSQKIPKCATLCLQNSLMSKYSVYKKLPNEEKKKTLTPPSEFSHLAMCGSTSAESQPVPGSIQAAEHWAFERWLNAAPGVDITNLPRRSARMRNEMLFMGRFIVSVLLPGLQPPLCGWCSWWWRRDLRLQHRVVSMHRGCDRAERSWKMIHFQYLFLSILLSQFYLWSLFIFFSCHFFHKLKYVLCKTHFT